MDYKNRNILYLDDLPQNLMVFEYAFMRHFKIFTTEQIQQAWEILEREEISVIISDQRMPEQLGINFLQEVSVKYPDVIRILLTAYTDINIVFDAINTGKVYAYITKPWDGEDLRVKLENALESYNLKKQNKELIHHLSISNAELNTMNIKLLKEIEENSILTHAIEQTSEIIMLMDTEKKIIYVNKAFENITLNKKEDIIGKSFFEIVNPEPQFPEGIFENLEKGILWKGRLECKKKNGEFFKHALTISAILNPLSEIINFVLVGRDVTKDTQIQEMLNQKQKLEAIGTLAGGIAHDFNNILVPIQGYAMLLEDEFEMGSQAWQDLQQIIEATERAKSLVDKILTFSRKRNIVIKKIPIAEVLKDALKFLKYSIPKNISIELDLSAENDFVLADPVQIQQIIINLCNNAIQAMEKKLGKIKISLKNLDILPENKYLYPDLQEQKEYLLMQVADEGTGIAPEIISKIFDPFFTTKEKSKGTGLGLSNVHGIVHSLRGAIYVESQVNKGTLFSVFLPTVHHLAKSETLPTTIEKGNCEWLILIDDDEMVLSYTSNILKELNYKVKAFLSSMEAFEFINEHFEMLHLIITDYNMPQMNAFELIENLKKADIHLPVIIITGYKHQISNELSEYQIIQKPFDTSQISAAIKKIIHRF